MRTHPKTRSGGWSLVELAVVLAVLAVLGMVLWRVLPLAPQIAAGDHAQRELARAEQALVGYVLANHHLPEPVSVDGLDMLPVQALGLPSTVRLRYQVPATLTADPGNPFVLALPAGNVVPARSNGLDFCMVLKQASLNDTTVGGMQGVATAFALMHPGQVGHDSAASAGFALPGSSDLGVRQVLAVGPGELASRLACPDRVARTRATARAANAAHELALVADRYQQFRVFAVQVAEMNHDNAETGVAFASFDVAWGVFCEVVAILQEAAGWPPDPLGIATGIASHVSATAQLAIAVANVVLAADGLSQANEDLDTANQQKAAADANLTRMQMLESQMVDRAKHLDEEGLQP